MTNVDPKLRQNLLSNIWEQLQILGSAKFQDSSWASNGDIHALEDTVEDFKDGVSGIKRRTLEEKHEYAEGSYGVLIASALWPVYLAVQACDAIWPKSPADLEGFLRSPEWLEVIKMSSAAFQSVDDVLEKDREGLPISYDL